MGTLIGSNLSSDRQNWEKVLNGLVRMLRTQQTELESLAKDRKVLQDRIQSQYDRWVSDVELFQYEISQTMVSKFEAAKLDLMVGQKHREAFVYKIKLDNVVSELADFRVWFDYLSSKHSETKENNSEISVLLSERDFIWNQYKKRETELSDQLKKKSTEVEHANNKILKLLTNLEQLQSSNSEKDGTILTLKTNMAELEAASIAKSEEISRLSGEVELLRKARSNSVTPVLRRCSAESCLGEKSRGIDSKNSTLKKESHPSRVPEKGRGSSKRKAVDANPISETPKLFTSTFKVPKLKNSSHCVA